MAKTKGVNDMREWKAGDTDLGVAIGRHEKAVAGREGESCDGGDVADECGRGVWRAEDMQGAEGVG